ncbi:MAG: hypothetical protein CEE38_02435 [Planctomycetes bacterium B3_Pla]|nr:MAG: hypothetical protein CEE38_02435 [Planctomycetes bacterium B3_Pla]
MCITAIGRLGSVIEAPTESLYLHVFLDAGGRASKRRVWGGLACVGDRELSWLARKLDDLKVDLRECVEGSGELKGKHVPTSIAKELGRHLREDDRRIVFWATWCSEMDDPVLASLRTLFSEFLSSQKADSYRLDRGQIDDWFRRIESYFARLKDVNRHKLISLLQHLKWLGDEVRRTRLGGQLRSVRVIVDHENFPDTETCAVLMKEAVAATFQAAGMSYRLTGSAFRQKAIEGTISVDLAGNSCKCKGLQYVDILLQVVQRQLPGFAANGVNH